MQKQGIIQCFEEASGNIPNAFSQFPAELI
jgi:hypothetical protein